MMWGNGYNMAWGWPVGLLLMVGLIVLVVWAVREAVGRKDPGSQRGTAPVGSGKGEGSQARHILEDRFARGELNAVEYRERLSVLEDKAR